MAGPTTTAYTDLTRSLSEIVSAHQAVIDGVADHAQKHEAERQAAYHKLEAERKLTAGVTK